MSETTARDLCKKAMLKAGITFKNETPDDDELNDALDTLNDLLDSYANESMLIYARTWETFTLSANVGKYTIGPGQNFDTARPTFIKAATTTLPGSNADLPMKIIDDESYFDTLIVKSQAGVPEFLNYDNAYPYANIRLWTVPSQVMALNLLTEKPLTTFLTLDQLIVLPPGWKRMLISNLGADLAGEYGQPINPNLQATANKSMGLIKRGIVTTRSMDSPIYSDRRRSILSDQY